MRRAGRGVVEAGEPLTTRRRLPQEGPSGAGGLRLGDEAVDELGDGGGPEGLREEEPLTGGALAGRHGDVADVWRCRLRDPKAGERQEGEDCPVPRPAPALRRAEERAQLLLYGSPLAVAAAWLQQAAVLGAAKGLSFYDACWAATARALGISLVSADVQLLDAGLAESPQAAAERLRLAPYS